MEQGRRVSAHFQEASRAVPLRLRGRNVLVAADQEFQSVVQRLANVFAHRKTRNGAAVAPAGVAELLASAFKPERQDLQGLSH